ncbi:SIS domain-containing protein [Mangrovitalea sediminis]|uniref:SIS domain-containing protein n=1 Tax=Mangrovitalea sediminis TaxID=1982043 RepID=UPI001D0D5AE7|nr:SIS domain-containing protein [Mangrovitalea sediminis]
MKTPQILQVLRQSRDNLRKSEQKVAEYVLRQPEDVIHMRIVDLATESHVSEPTIVRFCRAIGCDSFQGFKLALAQQLVRREVKIPFAIDASDSAEQLGRKLANNSMDCLAEVRDNLDWKAVQHAILKLSQARRVDFWGFGASGIVALDAQQKFFRLNLATNAYSDPDMQHMSAMTLAADDCVIAISHSGRTRNLMLSGTLAQEQGACLITLCPPGTPLFDLGDISLPVAINQDNETFTPMNSRLAHLVVLDILATGLYLQKRPDIDHHLDRVKGSLQPLKLPPVM